MKKYLRITFCLCLVFTAGTSFLPYSIQHLNSLVGRKEIHDTLFWTEDVNLKWSDFKGSVPKDNNWAGAEIHTNFYPNLVEYSNEFIRINIASYCIKDLSWVREDIMLEDNNCYSLKHELFHFHLTEFCARKFRKELLNAEDWTNINLENHFKSIAVKNYDYLADMHAKYDEETVNSLDTISQIYWENNILDSIKQFSNYSNPEIIIFYKK